MSFGSRLSSSSDVHAGVDRIGEFAVTLDVDWAPDFAIDHVASILLSRQVRATWLITHDSPALRRVAEHRDLFEIGIHPNFAPGSTHGQSPEEVLDHCLALAPDARAIRTHSLMQSTALLDLFLVRTSLLADLSVFLPYAQDLAPVAYTLRGRTIYRCPTFWEDDYEFLQPMPRWDAAAFHSNSGMKIFAFHPIHVYLNSSGPDTYERLKTLRPSLTEVPDEVAAPLVHQGSGAGSFFLDLVELIAGHGGGALTRDLVRV